MMRPFNIAGVMAALGAEHDEDENKTPALDPTCPTSNGPRYRDLTREAPFLDDRFNNRHIEPHWTPGYGSTLEWQATGLTFLASLELTLPTTYAMLGTARYNTTLIFAEIGAYATDDTFGIFTRGSFNGFQDISGYRANHDRSANLLSLFRLDQGVPTLLASVATTGTVQQITIETTNNLIVTNALGTGGTQTAQANDNAYTDGAVGLCADALELSCRRFQIFTLDSD